MTFDDIRPVDFDTPERSRTVIRDRYNLENKLEKHLQAGKIARPFWTAAAGILPFGLGGLITAGSDVLTDANIDKQNAKLNRYSAALGDEQSYNYSRLPSLDLQGLGQGISSAIQSSQKQAPQEDATGMNMEASFGGGSEGLYNPNAPQVTDSMTAVDINNGGGNGTWAGMWSNGGGVTGIRSYETAPATMEEGGTIKGASHAKGGVSVFMDGDDTGIDVEGGEKVINTEDWAMVMDLLDKGKSKQAKNLLHEISEREPAQKEMATGGTIASVENDVPEYIWNAVAKVKNDGFVDKELSQGQVNQIINLANKEANGTPRNTSEIYNGLIGLGYNFPTYKQVTGRDYFVEPLSMETTSISLSEQPISRELSIPSELNNSIVSQQISNGDTTPVDKVVRNNKSAMDYMKLLGGVEDYARMGLGLAAASTNLPKYNLPPEWSKYMDKSKMLSEQGLTPEQRAILNDQNASTYAKSVNDLVNYSGGDAGALLGNLTALNMNQYRNNANIALQDNNLERQNLATYNRDLLNDIALQKVGFDYQYDQAMRTKQAGAGLAQDAYSDIRNRRQFNDAYGANSMYQKAFDSLIQQGVDADVAAATLKDNPQLNLPSTFYGMNLPTVDTPNYNLTR